jgi:hypothetical protein
MNLQDALHEALSREVEPAYLLDRRGHILFINDAWDRAARAGGASPALHAQHLVGSDWAQGVRGGVKRYYAALRRHAFGVPEGDGPLALVHVTESNGPDLIRVVAHRLVPLYDPYTEGAAWLLVTHAQVVETPVHQRYRAVDAAPARYLDAQGTLTQCSSCRRSRHRAPGESRWEFCAALVQEPPAGTTFGLCGECRGRYYIRPQQEQLRGTRATRLTGSAALWLATRRLPPHGQPSSVHESALRGVGHSRL